jgi:hypothetical protein
MTGMTTARRFNMDKSRNRPASGDAAEDVVSTGQITFGYRVDQKKLDESIKLMRGIARLELLDNEEQAEAIRRVFTTE